VTGVKVPSRPLRLFDPPSPRRPALLLRWAGIAVPDQRASGGALPYGYPTLERAVAETIGLGAWCDALAWTRTWPACGDPRSRAR